MHFKEVFKGKSGEPDDPIKLHELDRVMCKVWEDPESESRFVPQQIFAWAGNFPPMQKCLVHGMLLGIKRQSVPKIGKHRGVGKRH